MRGKIGNLSLLQPQNRPWVRKIDALVVLLFGVAMLALLFAMPTESAPFLFRFGHYAALAVTPVLTVLLWRESDLNRLERLALLILMLAAGLALMVAAIELRQS